MSETLRIEIPSKPNATGTDQQFSVFETLDVSHIKHLLIHQEGYSCYETVPSPFFSPVIIPDTINKFAAVETIKIKACITELPVALSELTNLKLLDLSGCYNLMSIPDAVYRMRNLKIKVGHTLSEASKVIFITVPRTGIKPSDFSRIFFTAQQDIEQLVIHQLPQGFGPQYENIQLPDRIQQLTDLKHLSVHGNLTLLPSWIIHLDKLTSLDVSTGTLQQNGPRGPPALDVGLKVLPESIGNLSKLTSLNLSGCTTVISGYNHINFDRKYHGYKRFLL